MSIDALLLPLRASLTAGLLSVFLLPGVASAGPFHNLCAGLLAGDEATRLKAAARIQKRRLTAELVDEEVADLASTALRMEQPLAVVDAALALLEVHGHPHGADVITAMLWRRDGEVRERAVLWVETHPELALGPLEHAVVQLDPATRARVEPLVIEQLGSLDPKTRARAVAVVDAGGLAAARPSLLSLVSRDPALAFDALVALERVDPRWMNAPPPELAASVASVLEMRHAIVQWDGVLAALRELAPRDEFAAAHLRTTALLDEAQAAELAGRPSAAARAGSKAQLAKEESQRLPASTEARELVRQQAIAAQRARSALNALPAGLWRRYGERLLAASSLHL